MRCANPYTTQDGQAYGCGQCLPCRINKKREWTHRILLEAQLHADNAFVTLTYADENVPAKGSLEPKHLQDWLKRFRKSIEPTKIRYFAVGEYGDESQRPHYHVALFGFPTCAYGQSQNWRLRCCSVCAMVSESWGLGKVFLGTLEPHSAQYVAGYTTKKLTSRDDIRLNGRHPEFARMSLKPGIGRDFLWDAASTLMSFNLETSQVDVPSTLRHGKKELPLGRYLTRELRKMVGKDAACPPSVLQEQKEKLLPLQKAARSSKDAPSLRHQIILANKGKVASLTTRARIYKQRKTL